MSDVGSAPGALAKAVVGTVLRESSWNCAVTVCVARGGICALLMVIGCGATPPAVVPAG
ncbi:hypothetical protein D3C86_1562590 [compost metagenome]